MKVLNSCMTISNADAIQCENETADWWLGSAGVKYCLFHILWYFEPQQQHSSPLTQQLNSLFYAVNDLLVVTSTARC